MLRPKRLGGDASRALRHLVDNYPLYEGTCVMLFVGAWRYSMTECADLASRVIRELLKSRTFTRDGALRYLGLDRLPESPDWDECIQELNMMRVDGSSLEAISHLGTNSTIASQAVDDWVVSTFGISD